MGNKDDKELGCREIVIHPGSIVVIQSHKPHQATAPWSNAEGLLLGQRADGYMRILWYKEINMTLHWHPDNLKAKDPQEIASEISPDAMAILHSLRRYLAVGLIGA